MPKGKSTIRRVCRETNKRNMEPQAETLSQEAPILLQGSDLLHLALEGTAWARNSEETSKGSMIYFQSSLDLVSQEERLAKNVEKTSLWTWQSTLWTLWEEPRKELKCRRSSSARFAMEVQLGQARGLKSVPAVQVEGSLSFKVASWASNRHVLNAKGAGNLSNTSVWSAKEMDELSLDMKRLLPFRLEWTKDKFWGCRAKGM